MPPYRRNGRPAARPVVDSRSPETGRPGNRRKHRHALNRAELEAALDKRETCHVAALNAAVYALEARSK